MAEPAPLSSKFPSTTLLTTLAVSAALTFSSCTRGEQSPSLVARVEVAPYVANCSIGSPRDGFFTVQKSDSALYEKPNTRSIKVKDLKMSKNFGKFMPLTASPDTELRAECETKDWVQGRIVKIYNSDVAGGIGWIQKKRIIELGKLAPPKDRRAENENECQIKGEFFFKSLKAWPKLSDGRDAYVVAKDRCSRTIGAFDGI